MSSPASLAPPGSAATKYNFDADFQSKVAAMFARDTTFSQRTDGIILPEYFENQSDATLVSIGIDYYTKYKKTPSDKTVWRDLIAKAARDKRIRRDMVPLVWSRVDELEKVDISDREYVIERVSTFARHQAVSKAIIDSVGHLDFGNFAEIQSALQKAMSVGAQDSNPGYDFAERLEVRTEERLERAAGRLAPTGISTGFADIDKHLYHKGWGKKELSVVMGGPKSGKTTFLIDQSIAAIGSINRYNVLYLTLEVAARIVGERCDANISRHLVNELGTHIYDVNDKIKTFMDRAGVFKIHEYPTGSLRVSDIRRLLERYKSEGIKFDMLVVDYADLMQPERLTDNSIENSKSIYVNLRGLAMEEDLAVLTATQTNREGAKRKVATMTDVGDDFNKVRIADVLISINKDDEDRAAGRARLYFAACRNQAGGFSITVSQDIDRMRFITGVIGIS